MKKIKWLVQDVNMRISQLHRKFDALIHMNENFDRIGVIKNHPYITNLENVIEEDLDTKYVFLSGVRILNLLKSAKTISDVVEHPTQFQLDNSETILKALIDGFFYNYKTFDQALYSKLEIPLLNNDAEYYGIKENFELFFDEDKFVKPSRDLKAFDAGILPKGKSIGEYVESIPRQRFFLEEKLVVSSIKEMVDEYRCFVVGGEVVGISGYRENGIAKEHEVFSEQVKETASEYAKLYQPAEIFTMDLVRLKNDDIKIVEYNCFNCSGVYLCDMVNTFSKIKEHILKED